MRVLLVSSELLAGVVFEGAFYSRARSIPFSLSVTKFFSKHNNFKFKGFIIMFSFFVTVAEGAEGDHLLGLKESAENLLNSMKGGHKKPWTISLHNHTILIHHKQNYFIQHTMSDSFTKKTVAAPHTLVKIVSN